MKSFTVKRAKGAGSYHSILVPLLQPGVAIPLVQMACSLLAIGGSLILASIVEVPFQLPMAAAPELGEPAELLSRVAGYTEALGARVEAKVVRARFTDDAIAEVARRKGSDLIMLGYSPEGIIEERWFRRTAGSVRKKASCDMIALLWSQRRPVSMV